MVSSSCILSIPSVNITGLKGQGVYNITLGAIDSPTDYHLLKTDGGHSFWFTMAAKNAATVGLNLKVICLFRYQSYNNSSTYNNAYVAIFCDVGATVHPDYLIYTQIYEEGTASSYSTNLISNNNRYGAIALTNQITTSDLAALYGHTPGQNEYLLDTSKTRLWFDSINAGTFVLQGNYCAELFNNSVSQDDPYDSGGTSGTGGGNGSFNYTGDTITEPTLPTVGAASTGFVSLFNPTTVQLNDLANYLWSSAFDLDTIKRLYADPMQQFIGLSLVPVPVPSVGAFPIQVGGVNTGVSLNKASAQFVSVDCGTITFNSSSLTASYLDFLPYTKTQLYLPYIGIVDVSTDDIMDKSMAIKYHVDILTGGCIAYIIIGGSVMYQYSGQCAINIPLTSIDWSTTISSVLGLVSSAMNGLVAGAATPLTGLLGAAVGLGGIANMGASAVNAATSAKPTINKSGAIGGSAGILAVQKPYLIVTCPNLAHAENQDHYMGYPSFITKSISNCTGFCSFEEIYLSGLGLTDEEMEELHAIMKEGVYL